MKKIRQISLPQDHPNDYSRRLSVMLYEYLREIGLTVNALIDEVDACCGASATASPLVPKFFLGPADAYTSGTEAYLDGATPLTGGTASGKTGYFSLTTTAGNYGWVAVTATVSASGVLFYDGIIGYGGWSGAGQAGNYTTGDTTDTSTTLSTDSDGIQWRLFRQDYVDSSPSPTTFTIS